MRSLFLFFFFMAATAGAQNSRLAPAGEYYLQGVHEVASGFLFRADGSFEFFFSYGALDRTAKGTWKQQGDSLILANSKKPPLDFKLVKSLKKNNGQVTIKVTHSNAALLRNIQARLLCAEGVREEISNENGLIVFSSCNAKQLSLIHEFWPDRYSTFALGDQDYFEFAIEPWIADVEFDQLVYKFREGVLLGPHPLLKPGTYTFLK